MTFSPEDIDILVSCLRTPYSCDLPEPLLTFQHDAQQLLDAIFDSASSTEI